jgi:hypothetical protein
MIKVSVKVDTSVLNARLKKQQTALANLPSQGLVEFQKLTPRDTGNARSRTLLKGKNDIVGDYAYAQRLDRGWSKQAPQGMIKPFTKWWTDQIKKISRIK